MGYLCLFSYADDSFQELHKGHIDVTVLFNLVDLCHHGQIEHVSDLLGSKVFAEAVTRYYALRELGQRHELLATRQRVAPDVLFVNGAEGLDGDFQRVVDFFLPKHLFAPRVRVELLEEREEVLVEHHLEGFGDGVALWTPRAILQVLCVGQADEHLEEVVADQIVLRIELSIGFICVCLDALQVKVGQLERFAVNETLRTANDQVREDVDTDAEDVIHGVGPRRELVDLTEPLVDRPNVSLETIPLLVVLDDAGNLCALPIQFKAVVEEACRVVLVRRKDG